MLALLAIIRKELQLLWRDKPGLLILFFMPMFLVVILTFLHANDPNNPIKLPVLLLNYDSGKLGKEIKKELAKSDVYQLKDISKDKNYNRKKALDAVVKGKYQALIIIPRRLTTNVKNYSKWALSVRRSKPPINRIKIYYDPAIPESIKDALNTTMDFIARGIRTEALEEISEKLVRVNKSRLKKKMIQVDDLYATLQKKVVKPNTVQQHVPAWTIFGMFLIIIPIAGVMIKERDQGILQRFYIAPVSRINFLLGRIISFVMVNLIQLVLMILIGIYFFPLFDLPALNVVDHIGLVTLTGICIAFAATGFGVMMGTWAKTFEQAMAFGPILIVIAAALGGIFVPSFLMPNLLKDFVYYSPLYWSNNALMDILVRNEGFMHIAPDLLRLVGFFFVTLILTSFKFMRKV